MRRMSKTRNCVSTILLLAGILGVGIWTWSMLHTAVSQREASRRFDEQMRNAPPPRAREIPPAPKPGALIGRLVIPHLNLRAMVREGTDYRTLDIALGHVRGTAMPGAAGNVAIAGHRDTLFRCLKDITKDDRIVFETTYGTYTYSVENTLIVKPKDVGVLAPGSESQITLVTCYPFYYVGAAPDRFIVQGRLLPGDLAVREPAVPNQGMRWAPAWRQWLSRHFSLE